MHKKNFKIMKHNMKIEKKYRVNTDNFIIAEVNCFIDDDGKVIADADLGEKDFYAPRENELFFDTEDPARQSLASIVPTDEEIKKVLRFLNNAPEKKKKEHDETIKTVVDETSFFYMAIHGKVFDYITDNLTRFISGSFVRRLRLLVQQRILDIGDGISVPIDNISYVNWGEEDRACKLILKNGTVIVCSEKGKYDLWFVKLVFGKN